MSNEYIIGAPDSEILYDKIINVELIRTAPNKQIFVVLGTTGEAVDTKKSVIDIQPKNGNTQKTFDLSNQCIAIYKGDSHREYYMENNKVKSRNVRSQGNTISIKYKDSWWSDETIVSDIKTALKEGGCLISLNNEGRIERFHAAYLKEDMINTRDYIVEDSIKIACKEGSIKPTIAFSTSLIPGANCYKMVLKIYNLNLDFDIREVTRVEVVAGYRTLGTFMYRFSCPVFSSYIESPNPDGVTVFECLAVGRTNAFIKNKPVELNYLGGTITVDQFLGAIAAGLDLQLHDCLLQEYQDIPLNMRKMGTFAENGTAVITWAQQIIQNCIAASEGAPEDSPDTYEYSRPYIQLVVTPGVLCVYALNRQNKDTASESINVVSLDAVKGASFNGVALTVKAAWNPYIQPGSVFRMVPNIINGANLPNTLQDDVFGKSEKDQYLYRCITANISFSTNGSENEMSLLAVPIKYVDSSTAFSSQVTQTIGSFARRLHTQFKSDGGYKIDFGDSNSKEVANTEDFKRQKIVTTNTNNMFDLDIMNIFSNTKTYEIVQGNNLSYISEQWFSTKGAPDGNTYCDFDLDLSKEDIDKLPPGVYRNKIPKAALWPLIAVLTYRYWNRANMLNTAGNPFETMDHMANPNKIQAGKQLVIPTIPSMDVLKRCREIFKYAYKAYSSGFPSYGEWSREWKSLYQYLGGTWDE